MVCSSDDWLESPEPVPAAVARTGPDRASASSPSQSSSTTYDGGFRPARDLGDFKDEGDGEDLDSRFQPSQDIQEHLDSSDGESFIPPSSPASTPASAASNSSYATFDGGFQPAQDLQDFHHHESERNGDGNDGESNGGESNSSESNSGESNDAANDESQGLDEDHTTRIIPVPPVSQLFDTYEDLMTNLQGFHRENGAGIVVRTSYSRRDLRSGSQATRIVFECDRGRSRPSTSVGLRAPASQRIDCPYSLVVSAAEVDGRWKWSYKVSNHRHNHGPSLHASAHNIHRRRTKEHAEAWQCPW